MDYWKPSWNTCRVCGDCGERLIKYSTRHYAHAGCGLEKWGSSFFDRLQSWQIEQFPCLVAAKHGVNAELVRRINENKKAAT
jgi:hypothetical protein